MEKTYKSWSVATVLPKETIVAESLSGLAFSDRFDEHTTKVSGSNLEKGVTLQAYITQRVRGPNKTGIGSAILLLNLVEDIVGSAAVESFDRITLDIAELGVFLVEFSDWSFYYRFEPANSDNNLLELISGKTVVYAEKPYDVLGPLRVGLDIKGAIAVLKLTPTRDNLLSTLDNMENSLARK